MRYNKWRIYIIDLIKYKPKSQWHHMIREKGNWLNWIKEQKLQKFKKVKNYLMRWKNKLQNLIKENIIQDMKVSIKINKIIPIVI